MIFNIVLSIFVCADASSLFASLASAHVFAPYVNAGSTHGLHVDLSLQACSNVILENVATLANAVHPTVILLSISLS